MKNKQYTSDFEQIYKIGTDLLVNERFEDDEGFYKNHYQWATQNTDNSVTIHKQVPDTSSYTSWSEAIEAFKTFLKKT